MGTGKPGERVTLYYKISIEAVCFSIEHVRCQTMRDGGWIFSSLSNGHFYLSLW
jgi:hypothetical protein